MEVIVSPGAQPSPQVVPEQLINNLPVMVAVSDLHGNVIFANRHVTTFTGQPEEDLLGLAWRRIVHPQDIPVALRSLSQVADGGLVRAHFVRSGPMIPTSGMK